MLDAGQPGFAHHIERQRIVQLHPGTEFQPLIHSFIQLAQQTLVALTGGQQEVLQQLAQTFAPDSRRSRLDQQIAGAIQRFQQGHQRTDQRRIQPADFIIGLDTGTGVARAHRVSEQHAPQAEAPGVGFQPVGQPEVSPPFGVHAPADAGPFDPAAQCRQLAFLNTEAGAQRRHIQQTEHLAHRQPAIGQP